MRTWLFPAHAGVILSYQGAFDKMQAFPRPCGGDPNDPLNDAVPAFFSPPMRG